MWVGKFTFLLLVVAAAAWAALSMWPSTAVGIESAGDTSASPTQEMSPREVIQDEVRNAHAWRLRNELPIRATENRARLTGNPRPVTPG